LGALFLVNARDDGSFDDYLFLNVGYVGSPAKVFVEFFGADGGNPIDGFAETSLSFAPNLRFQLDLWIASDAYTVAVDGAAAIAAPLAQAPQSLGLFEVGVQQKPALRGLIDYSAVSRTCRKYVPKPPVLAGDSPAPALGKASALAAAPGHRAPPCHRNALIRMARNKIQTEHNPPMGLRILAALPDVEGCGEPAGP
jgi:hypothetical protein